MVDIMGVANRLIGMVKYATERSGDTYVIGKKGWKTISVSKLMYRCGVLAWSQQECEDSEVYKRFQKMAMERVCSEEYAITKKLSRNYHQERYGMN